MDESNVPLALEFFGKPKEETPLVFATTTIAPNPFTSSTRVFLNAHPKESVSLTIFNNLGQSIYNQEIEPNEEPEEQELNSEIFKESGIYWLVIQQEDRRRSIKQLIKI